MPQYNSVMDFPPSRLYKYRYFDIGHESGNRYLRDCDIIEYSSVWASSPNDFNDPYDCIPSIDLSGSLDEREAFLNRVLLNATGRKLSAELDGNGAELAITIGNDFNMTKEESLAVWANMLKNFGCICLAERPDDMLMWSYYSNGHKGYCLEFDTKYKPFIQSHRVLYSAERSVFRVLDKDRANLMERTLIRKAKFWSHEREWRIVSRPVGRIEFPAEALKAIIFGANVDLQDEQAIRSMLNRRFSKVQMKRAKLDHRTFELSIVDA